MAIKYYKCNTGFTMDMINNINDYRIDNNIKIFSNTVRVLVEHGLKYKELYSILINISNTLDKINNKLNYNNKLVKQIYSDLELEYHTNIKYNKELKRLDNNIFRDNFDN